MISVPRSTLLNPGLHAAITSNGGILKEVAGFSTKTFFVRIAVLVFSYEGLIGIDSEDKQYKP